MSDFIYVFLDMVIHIALMCIVKRKLLVKKDKRLVIGMVVLTCGYLLVRVIASDGSLVDSLAKLLITSVVIYIICKPQTTKFFATYLIAILVGIVLQTGINFLIPEGTVNKNIVQLVLFGLVCILGIIDKYVIKGKINLDVIPKNLLIGIGVMILSLVFVITGILAYTNDMDTGILPQILAGAAVVVFFAVIGVALQSISAQISKLNLEKEKDILQNYNEQQKKYYELVLKSEEDTRRFRHDMMNHMFCLENYLQEGKYDDCKEYIANITNSLNHSRRKIYYTGNKVSDVMLTNILENKKEDVDVVVTGRLKDDIPISDFDLCIVVSNIVKNAVEAVNKQSDESKKYIKINFTMGKRYLRIEERNSIDQYQVENAKKFETAKEDKKAHGLGVKNVKMIVEKYNGRFKSEVQDDEFYVCVEMDMKSAK